MLDPPKFSIPISHAKDDVIRDPSKQYLAKFK